MAAAQEKTLAHSRSRDKNLQREWRFIQNGGYGEKSEKIWVRDMAKVKINKMVEKAGVQFKGKKEEKRQVLHVRDLRIRQSVRGLGFAVPCFFFVILKLGVMGLSVLCFMRLSAINCLIVTLLQIRPS